MNSISLTTDNSCKFSKETVGNKAYNLLELSRIGINVPEGIILPTDICLEYYLCGKKMDDKLKQLIVSGIRKLELDTGKRLGDISDPLILSVRSGAPASMPGMMDTILDVGLNDYILRNCRHVHLFQSYLRFIKTYAQAVHNLSLQVSFAIDGADPEELAHRVSQCKLQYQRETGEQFPEDIIKCVINCVIVVWDSWNSHKAIFYRKNKNIRDDMYTAILLQRMVFGNFNAHSGAGVIFTQNPLTGDKELYGEYLPSAQGEDIVSGIANPKPIEQLAQERPTVYDSLARAAEKIEKHFGCPQDIEFTYEDGTLYLLQTRNMSVRKKIKQSEKNMLQ
jgi:pyruvate,orthophosphate dikinase